MAWYEEMTGSEDETIRARFTRLRLADREMHERVLREPAAIFDPLLLVMMPDLVERDEGGYRLLPRVQSWVMAQPEG